MVYYNQGSIIFFSVSGGGKSMKRHDIFSWLEIFVIILIWAGLALADRFETFKYYPVSNTLATDGVQYGDSILYGAATADTAGGTRNAKYLPAIGIDPGLAQTGRYNTLMSLYAYVVVSFRGIDTTGIASNFRWWIEAKDTTDANTWTIASDTQNVQSILDTTFKLDTLSGYIDGDIVDYLPAQMRIGMRSDTLNKAVLRLKNTTYIESVFKTLE